MLIIHSFKYLHVKVTQVSLFHSTLSPNYLDFLFRRSNCCQLCSSLRTILWISNQMVFINSIFLQITYHIHRTSPCFLSLKIILEIIMISLPIECLINFDTNEIICYMNMSRFMLLD